MARQDEHSWSMTTSAGLDRDHPELADVHDDDLYGAGDGGGGYRRRKRRRGHWVVLAIMVGVLAVGLIASTWLLRHVQPGDPGDEVRVSIPEGSTQSDVARILEDEGIITSASVFGLYSRFRSPGTILAGTYTFVARAPMGDVVGVLRQGPEAPPSYRVTLPEGLTVAEMTERVGEVPIFDSARFAEAVASGVVRSQNQPADVSDMEGFLFPETYEVQEGQTEADFLALLVSTFDETAAELGIAEAAQRLGVSPYDIVKVASMVEREAKVPEDRARMARVMYNRLERGEALGIDATLLYGVGPDVDPQKVDPQMDHPYNTRATPGLPPTPISNPGRASLDAAINPADGDWRWYVLTDPSGAHSFTNDYNEFLRLKAKAQAEGVF